VDGAVSGEEENRSTTQETEPAQTQAASSPAAAIGPRGELDGRAASPVTGLPEAPVRLTREDIELLKATIGREARMSDSELLLFARICERWQLDPFLREIWAVRFKEGEPLSIFASRDGMLKAARRDPAYQGPPVAFSVREQDEFEVEVDGDQIRVHFRMGKPPRGPLLGAWAMLPAHGRRAAYYFADINEHRRQTRSWQTNPEALIIKCAEAAVLRRQFGLSGLLMEGEEEREAAAAAGPPPPALPAPEPPTRQQLAACEDALLALGYSPDRVQLRLAAIRTREDAEQLLQAVRSTGGRRAARRRPADRPAEGHAPSTEAPAPSPRPRTLTELLDTGGGDTGGEG
jgi:hypothetical protein